MEKRDKSSQIEHGFKIFGFIKRFFIGVKAKIFPSHFTFYIKEEGRTITPAMSRKQISAITEYICKSAIQESFKGSD